MDDKNVAVKAAVSVVGTGPAGGPWRRGLGRSSVGGVAQCGVPIRCQIIGPGCAIEDAHGDVARIREVSESGALLIRPDVYAGWWAELVSADATERLRAARRKFSRCPLKRSPNGRARWSPRPSHNAARLPER